MLIEEFRKKAIVAGEIHTFSGLFNENEFSRVFP